MQTEQRATLFGWVLLVVIVALAADAFTGVDAVPLAFLSFPAGLLLVLVATAFRHYFGTPATPPEAS